MVILRNLSLFLLFLTMISCAKIQYIYEQGKGQISLLNRGIDNSIVLRDQKILEKHKDKIRKIEAYKKYFFRYFNLKSGEIYSKTTFLRNKAVSHMVIVSKFNKVQALEECFPFVGCFPYLAFFNEKSAFLYAKKKENDGLIIWKRPVYAYSTLNYFTDTILSSFFYYSDEKLAELIFHELLHTVFFIKNDIDMSESLAQFFGREMSYEYFKEKKFSQKSISMRKKDEGIIRLKEEIVKETDKLNSLYNNKNPENQDDASRILNSFLEDSFYPNIKNVCQEYKLFGKKCFPLNSKWNNARFAAHMTYEKNVEKIHELFKRSNLDLKGFYFFLKKEYDIFKSSDKDNFLKFLFKS